MPSPVEQPSASRAQVVLAGHLGDAATARSGLAAQTAAVRASALGALARLGSLGMAELTDGFHDTSPVVRRRACELSCRLPGAGRDPALVGRLRAALDDPDPAVVEAACFALGEAGSAGAGLEDPGTADGDPLPDWFPTDALASVTTGHPDPLCREAAVAALGALGDRRALAAILAATEDRPAVRRRAVLALAAFDGPDVDRALERARHDRDWQVRQAAEDLTY